MKELRTLAALVAAAMVALPTITGCAGMSTREKDTLVGAGIGAAGGAIVSGGSALGTVGGAAVGGIVGNQVGKGK
jgi:osmotically inducible lipoprotein OsmB